MDGVTGEIPGARRARPRGYTGVFHGTGVFYGAGAAGCGVWLAGLFIPAFTISAGAGLVVLFLFLCALMVAFHRATEWSAVRLPRRGDPELVSRGVALSLAMVLTPVTALLGYHILWMETMQWPPYAGWAAFHFLLTLPPTYVLVVPIAQWIQSRLARAAAGLQHASGESARVPGENGHGSVATEPADGWRPVAQAMDLVVAGVVALMIALGVDGPGVGWPTVAAGVVALIIALAGAAWLVVLRAEPPL